MKADILGVPIERTMVTEAGCLGAAFIAGLGTGRYSSPDDIKRLVSVDRVFEPRDAVTRTYEPHFAMYSAIRERVEGLDVRAVRT